MKLNKILKKLDITLVRKLSKEEQITIADNVATMISDKFNYIDYGYIYTKLTAAKMYTAKIPEGISDVLYLYELDTLLINYVENLNTVSEVMLYQCIHALQDIRNKKGMIKQLGQCTFTEFKTYAIALNEASIQYMVSRIFDYQEQEVEAYGIRAKTFGTNKYPLICNILKQLLFITREETLVKSTINSLDEFIIEVIEELGEGAFSTVRNNLDDMLYASEEIIDIKRKIKKEEDDSQQIDEALKRINNIENLMKKTYVNTQLLIFTTYFDKLFKRIETLEDTEYYLNKLNEYKNIMGTVIDNSEDIDKFYDDYYKDKKEKINSKKESIINKEQLALMIVSKNKIVRIFYLLRANLSRLFG